MKKILLYGYDKTQISSYLKAADSCGFKLCLIGDDLLQKTLDEVFACNKYQTSTHEKYADAYMIFEDMDKQALVTYLQELEKEHCSYDGIKIMRTPINASWTLDALFQETNREHQLMKKVMILQELLKQCNGLDYASLEEEKKMQYRQELMQVFVLLNKGEYSEAEIDDALVKLSDQLQHVEKIVS